MLHDAADAPHPRAGPQGRRDADWLPLAAILLVAVTLRAWRLDAKSLWYDEVVSMRLAEAPGPAAMLDLLGRIDGTRAPLHPLLLHAWMGVFGGGSCSARAFSAALGCGTVILVYVLGRRAWDDATGRWGAWLCALCPPLVAYSQEVRMYALLVFLAVLSWLAFLAFRRRPTRSLAVAYGLSLAAMAYTHPLGLFMIAAHGLVGLVALARGLLPGARWLAAVALAGAVIAPWLPRYLDHGTDYPMPRYSPRFLLGVPIEYIGGPGVTLLAWGALIAAGLLRPRDGRVAFREPEAWAAAVGWFAAPPLLMYAYSWASRPIFGPSRYHLFVAPAYMLLVGAGLAVSPRRARWALAAAMAALTVPALMSTTYASGHKADWRSAAAWIRERRDEKAFVIVDANDERFRREPLETARYYLAPDVPVELAGSEAACRVENSPGPGIVVYHVSCLAPADGDPDAREGVMASFHGLAVTRVGGGGGPGSVRGGPGR
ncbi:hypothetical protein OJF2_44830 [Aquisphaera giovannonii]|uniref:Glycosyltransferase RgtA/B/C/D-like domain-containing protein n=1 Tax=Aquisphaera giovannonii TaxID=406548 RepID=A0A5B9W5H7_9BACT|nr:glycosyltransferase family 39 protein [Aquisphaera giovannonii]QEH35926.1 hypothetical protein OJF2_44830 [Aquisphaera giovannonii]